MVSGPHKASGEPGSTGSMATALMTASAQEEKANIASAYESQKNREFQERMSNTAHQREIADLKKAGLNPILTGKYGGSSTPSGSMAQMQKGDISKTASTITSAVAQSRLSSAQIANLNASTEKTNAETTGTLQANDRAENRFPLELDQLISGTGKDDTTSASNLATIKKTKAQILALAEELEKLKVTRKLYTAAGALLPESKKIKNTIKDILEKSKYKKGAEIKSLPQIIIDLFKSK